MNAASEARYLSIAATLLRLLRSPAEQAPARTARSVRDGGEIAFSISVILLFARRAESEFEGDLIGNRVGQSPSNALALNRPRVVSIASGRLDHGQKRINLSSGWPATVIVIRSAGPRALRILQLGFGAPNGGTTAGEAVSPLMRDGLVPY